MDNERLRHLFSYLIRSDSLKLANIHVSVEGYTTISGKTSFYFATNNINIDLSIFAPTPLLSAGILLF